jgi:hypothetical protein
MGLPLHLHKRTPVQLTDGRAGDVIANDLQ